MIKIKKIAVTIIACAFALLIIIVAAVLVAPKIVDTPMARDKVRSAIHKTSGVEIDFKHLRLGLFPQPFVILEQVKMALPSHGRGTVASMRIQPEISALFQGKIQLDTIGFESAELDYTLPIQPAAKKNTQQHFSFSDLEKSLPSALALLLDFKIPDLDILVSNSKVDLFNGDRKILEFNSIHSKLEGTPTSRKFTLKCTSTLWQTIAMSGLLNTRTYKGSGQLQLSRFRPQGLAALPLPDSTFQVVDAPADLTINFKTDGPGQLQAEAVGAAPYLKLRFAEDMLELKNPYIKTTFKINNDSISLAVPELTLDQPQLNISASLDIARTTPVATLQVTGTQIDVAAMRKQASVLSGKNKTIKNILDIVRGGSIPHLTVKVQGQSLSDLANLEKIVVSGRINNGEIHIQDSRLDLQDVSGDVVISDGILHAKHIDARLGGLSGKNGILKLDLIQDNTPYTLAMDVQTELSQLPSVLQQVIDNKKLPQELAFLEKMKGSATAKLTVVKNTGAVQVAITDFLLNEAEICGISLTGTGKLSEEVFEYDLTVFAKDQELGTTFTCLAAHNLKADGIYRLKGNFQGRGKAEDLLNASTGKVELTVPEGGRIYRDILLLDILKFLHPFKKLSDTINPGEMRKKGFGYHSLRIKASVQDGMLSYDNAVLRGQPMTILTTGKQNLHNGKLNLTLLVAPLVTADRLFEQIPLIGPILDSMDTVPINVKGTFDNLHLYPLAPSAVGYGLKEMMKKTVGGPINLIQKAVD